LRAEGEAIQDGGFELDCFVASLLAMTTKRSRMMGLRGLAIAVLSAHTSRP